MKRQLILALVIATAGCSAPPAPTAPADAAADTPSPAAEPDAPATTQPAPAPDVDDAAANDTTVPVRFRGEWAADSAACTSPGHESQLRMDGDRIAFHESSGEILSVAGGGSGLSIVARLTGEGETREAAYRFRLSEDGKTLTDTSSGMGMVRRRCE